MSPSSSSTKTTATTSKTTTATALPSSSALKETSEINFMSDGGEEEDLSSAGDLLSVGDMFWGKCPGYPWWPCMLIGRLLTTETTQTPHYKIVGTTKMWCALLFGTREYTWVATDGLIAYTQLRDVPSFSLPVLKAALPVLKAGSSGVLSLKF